MEPFLFIKDSLVQVVDYGEACDLSDKLATRQGIEEGTSEYDKFREEFLECIYERSEKCINYRSQFKAGQKIGESRMLNVDPDYDGGYFIIFDCEDNVEYRVSMSDVYHPMYTYEEVLEPELSLGRQSLNYVEVAKVVGDNVVKIVIKSDSVDFQCYAKALIFDPDKKVWNSLCSIPYGSMKTESKLYYHVRSGDLACHRRKYLHKFKKDRDKLIYMANKILIVPSLLD